MYNNKKNNKQGQFRFTSRLVITAGSMFWKTLGWSANWHNAFRRFARNNYRLHNSSACLSIYFFFFGYFLLVLHAVVIFPRIFFSLIVPLFSSTSAVVVFRLAYSHGNRCSETSILQ
uniref:Transmembrane protein n=1 Tax=Sipha flava TaxID=143950 RepID=A0A2S2QI61_9HEMI